MMEEPYFQSNQMDEELKKKKTIEEELEELEEFEKNEKKNKMENEKGNDEFEKYKKILENMEWYEDFCLGLYKNPNQLSDQIQELYMSEDPDLKELALQLLANPKKFAIFFADIYEEQELINLKKEQKFERDEERRRKEEEKRRKEREKNAKTTKSPVYKPSTKTYYDSSYNGYNSYQTKPLETKPKQKQTTNYLDNNNRYSYQTNSYTKSTSYSPKKTTSTSNTSTNKTTTYTNSYYQKKIPQKPKYDESIIQTLTEFGVPRERCAECLDRANGDISIAANLYYSHL
ncbi:spore coat protein sp96 [Anaeramoeba flamelloides]|uniref:Spore coat protein sp96 n=1 Tax=Anaeramoeba flamelloides TaxID=1746091 RepID=A0ABQ8X5C4_9EUKA|nr:spore coat protein sp96 [Anaeramoeba flamelloides]